MQCSTTLSVSENISLVLVLWWVITFLRARDYYVVVREFVSRNAENYHQNQLVTSRHLHSFDDYGAARAFFDTHESYAAVPSYEEEEQVNYIYAVSAISLKRAEAKLARKRRSGVRLAAEKRCIATTPYSVRLELRKYWREAKKMSTE